MGRFGRALLSGLVPVTITSGRVVTQAEDHLNLPILSG